MKLVLETKDQPDETPTFGVAGGPALMMTPRLDDDYWLFRVQLGGKQAIVGFPKFSTIGIGFAVEEADWNTNFPFWCTVEETWNHIKHNKGDDSIPDELCIEAIRMVREAAAERLGAERCTDCRELLTPMAVRRGERFCSTACAAGEVSS